MIKISADSTCDLSPELLEKLDISIVPLTIVAGEETYLDGVDITPGELFRFVEDENRQCRTAAINTFDYLTRFKEYLKDYNAVIHICISSEFSSCYQNALLAAADLKNVYVVDSRNLSSGSGHAVCDAALKAGEGWAPERICAYLEEVIPKIEASFIIDKLDYLRRGGRCSALTAHGARVLQLKPCIEVTNGAMTVGKKYKGSFEKCLARYVRDRLEGRDDIDYSRIFITHTACAPEVVKAVREAVDQYAPFDKVIETRAGCTVSNHCGPNTLGILFKRK